MSALFLGMVLALEYDCIRIFRRVIRHKNIWVMSAEDILYWIYAAVTVFCMTYEVNDGILRGFLVTGFLAGAVLYRYAFGTFFVKYTTKFINLCLKPLKKALCLIKIGVHKITGCIKAAAVSIVKRAKSIIMPTIRERETRRKRQKQSAILGMVLAFALVMIMGAVIWSGKRTLEKQNKEYQARVAQLQEQVEEQQNRSDEIDEYKKYIQTKKFAEEVAKDKFGMIYPDELVFKPEN